jgi:anthraniloyl-CoA monooxygenase
VVHERNEPGATFGFGVGLTGRAQRSLLAADNKSFAAIRAVGHVVGGSEMRSLDGSRCLLRGPEHFAVGRAELLTTLLEHAERAGVRVEYGTRFEADDLDADVVVAADGARSASRTKLSDELGAQLEVGTSFYLWCGADFALESTVFAPVATEHGVFVAHAYPYSRDRSTFLVETDEPTWRRAGFDLTTAATDGADSDEASMAFLQNAFSELLGGHQLLGNRTRWMRFQTVSCERWHAGRTVLLGDAAHTAHYSVGSGTKLAMEDAIGLVQALISHDDRADAFACYQRHRRVAVGRLQRLARRSQQWWDSFPHRANLPADLLAHAFITRTGNVSSEAFSRHNSAVVKAALRRLNGSSTGTSPTLNGVLAGTSPDQRLSRAGRLVEPADLARWRIVDASPAPVCAASAEGGPVVVELPDAAAPAWGPRGDRITLHARHVVALGADAFMLTGADQREAVLDRLAFGERLRTDTGVPVVVSAPAELAGDLVDGILAGRTDLVCFSRKGGE